jgi:hypothetical protein
VGLSSPHLKATPYLLFTPARQQPAAVLRATPKMPWKREIERLPAENGALQELVEDLQSGIAEPALQLGTSAGGHQALCQYRARIARRQARLLFGSPAASKSHSPGQLVRFDVISYCSAWKPRSGRFGLCTAITVRVVACPACCPF